MFGRLLESFLARIPVGLSDLRTAFHDGDAARALRVAHRLKGATATVGAAALSASAGSWSCEPAAGPFSRRNTSFPSWSRSSVA
jgi:HPt (histidine-containing phosphotransfer) domain-containing protein